eukprot:572350-Prorocentrum_minimum.AAC.1
MCFHKSGDDLYPITVVNEDDELDTDELDEGFEIGPEAEHRERILDRESLLIETEETRPDCDIEPAEEWTIAERDTGQEGEWVGVYSPAGRWQGDIERSRLDRLHSEYERCSKQEDIIRDLKPKDFPQEVGMCLRRYRTGASQGGSRK